MKDQQKAEDLAAQRVTIVVSLTRFGLRCS